MKNEKLNTMIKISLLGVIAFLLMFLEFAIPVFPTFLKVDISDLPALIGAFALGPVAGVGIELLKNVLHAIFKGGSAFIGEFANFAVGSVIVLIAGYMYNAKKSKKTAIISLVVGTLVMSIFAGILNYYVLLPLYEKVLGFPIAAVVGMGSKVNPNVKDLNTLILWAIIPFNLIKGFIISVVTLVVYKSVSPALHDNTFSHKVEMAEN